MSVAQRIQKWRHRLNAMKDMLVPSQSKTRRASVEQMEPRNVMAADPIWLGGVYVEAIRDRMRTAICST